MSIILYHKGVIAADSRGIIDQGKYTERLCGMLKLFSFGGKVVMGMVGDNTTIDWACKEFFYFSEKVIEMEEGDLDTLPLSKDILERYGMEDSTRTLCFMTRRHHYYVGVTGIIRWEKGIPWAAGNGMRTALQSLSNGFDVESSVRNAILMNPDCGGTVVIHHAKDLELIKRKKSK
ncbi:ATP-dependent protease subunit [Serratia phage Moabite]|uniref:ATP-dependent protease subunit n=2 Tax=Moabitevirus TaxID=2843422 RepID=A0A4Y5TPP3_9CAUD|nr:peptidase HslV family [Serratia phage vB_SmaM_ 2050HW]YP_009849411.1 peptidase HslV family [Serratia phage Moabite]UCR74838.1 hypothetical protein [Serratia phage BUCT660]UGO54199.1 hypothetical protein HAYMO_217 [Serratia phage vB_SmaM_Haymo]ATA65582.1 hypothetical protein 2050HW_00247 [Serratia phage vB_SmaM_ 2050HW]QDB71347.1 ATP-dependent protease subunit [Serratia phage Moabite]